MLSDSKTSMHKMCSILLVLLTTQQAFGFSTPKPTKPISTQSLLSDVQVAWVPRTPSALFMAEESEEKESSPVIPEPEEDETEATTTGLIIPGFSDQVEVAPEPPAKKKAEPPKKKEAPKKTEVKEVTKEEAISKAESVITEAKNQGAGFNLSNPFAKSADKQQVAPKPPTPPSPPTAEKKLGDKDVSPLDLMKLARGETTAKAVQEQAQQKQVQVTPQKSDGPSIPSLPKISLPFQKQPKQPPPPPADNDPISSAIGGALTGAALGLYTNVATDFLYDTDLPPIVPPAALGVAIAATAFTGANQPNLIGKLSSFVFGGPIRYVKNLFVKKVEDTIDNIKATPGRIVKGVEDKIDQTVEDIKATPGRIADAIEDKIEETVEEIKATPGKVAEGIERKVEETVKDIEETVEEVISLPGKKLDELSEALGVKSEPKAEIPRPPPANTLPSEPKKSLLPPPDAKLSLPSLSLPKILEAEKKPVPPTPSKKPQQPTPALDFPKISLPKVEVSLPVSTPEKPKVSTPPPPKKEEPILPSLSLPSISIPKPEKPKAVASTPPSPPKPAKKKNDPYVFTEAALKEYIQKDKPAITELDKQQEEERKRREAENARIAQLAGPLFPERSDEAEPVAQSVPPKKKPTLSVPKIAPAATKAPPKKQEVVKVPPVKGRPTFSLFGMGGAPPKPKPESAPEAPFIARTTPAATAPRGVPTISKWKFDPSDNSISGFISGSSSFKDGEPITTSAIVGEASSNTVIRTKSGSRYFLGDEETSRGGGIFGFLGGGGSSGDSAPVASPVSDSKSKAVDTLAVRLEAQRKRDEEKQRLAAEAALKKAEQEAARKRAADDAAAEREQQAVARKQAEEEKRRIAEEKKAAQEEARQQAAAKRAEQEAARQRAAEEARIKREKEAEEKRLAQEAAREKAQAAAKKMAAPKQQEEAPRPSEPRPTFSLFGLGGGTVSETVSASTPAVKSQPVTTSSSAPRGVPTISKWTLNSDNTISGFISGSSAFNNNDPITTSAIVGQASSNTVVRTKSGSRYFLGESASGVGGFSLFGGAKSPTLSVKPEPVKESGPNKAAIQAEARKKAEEERKRLQEEANAKRAAEAAAKQAAVEEKKRLQEEANAKRAAEAAANKAAVEEKKRLQEEANAKRAAEAAAKKAVQEEKKRLQEEANAKGAAEAAAKKAAQEEAKAKQLKKQQAEKAVSSAPRGVTISLFGFGQKNDDTDSSSSTSAPGGVPTISRWRQESDGSITGVISGSSAFKNGDPITTSPIRGKAVGGSVVTTKSGSKYFLSETGTPAKQTTKASNDAAKERQLAAKKAEEKKQLLAAQAAEKQRQAEERKRVAEEKKAAELAAKKELAEKKKQEQAAKAKQAAKRAEAQSVVKSAKKGSTISLFGFGQSGDESSTSSTPVPTKKSPTLQVQQQTRPSAPNGVPTISGWKLNGDGSISGRISGSPNFKSGELITTSQIQKGRIESGEVVQTGSGSRYYLG